MPELFPPAAAPLLPAALLAAWAAVRDSNEAWPAPVAAALVLGAASEERVGWFLLALLPAFVLAAAVRSASGLRRPALAPFAAAGGALAYAALLDAAAGDPGAVTVSAAAYLRAALWTALAAALLAVLLTPLRPPPYRGVVRMSEPGRLRLLQAVAAGAFVLLALQLVRLQLIDSARNADTGSSEHLRTTDIEPPRGLIYDRNGILVASNVPRFFVSLVPGELPPDAAALRSALRAVERHTELPYGELEQLVARGLDAVDPLAPVPVLDVPDFERAIELRAADRRAAGRARRGGPRA